MDLNAEYDRLKESLQCPICLETLSKPVKILSCLHSFCSLCLDSLLSSSSSSSSSSSATTTAFPCPLCRKPTEVPEIGVAGLRDDLVSHCAIDHLKNLEAQLEADSPFSPPPPPPSLKEPPRVQMCPNHQGQALSRFCAQCNELVCFDCIQLSHRTHPVGAIDPERARKLRQETKDLIEIVKKREEQITESIVMAQIMEETIDEALEVNRAKVLAVFERFERVIRERRDKIVVQLEQKSSNKLEALSLQRKQLDRNFECLQNSCSFSASLLANPDDQLFLYHFKQTLQQLKRLRDDPSLSRRPVEEHHLEFHADEKLLEKLETSFGSIYQIRDIFKGGNLSDSERQRLLRKGLDYSRIEMPSVVFGSKGTAPGQFDFATGLAVDRDDNLFVCDFSNCRIQVFDPQFKFVREFGTKGRMEGQFDRPISITIDSRDRLIITDYGNDRLQIMDAFGNVIKTISTFGSPPLKFSQPIGVHVDENDNIIVCDHGNHRLQVFDKNCDYLRTIGSRGSGELQFEFPCDVKSDGAGKLFVADFTNGRVQVLDIQGNYIKSFGKKGSGEEEIDGARGLAIDCHSNIIVCDRNNHRLQVFDHEGSFIKGIGSLGSGNGQFNKPVAVTFNSKGSLIASDCLYRIQVFSADDYPLP